MQDGKAVIIVSPSGEGNSGGERMSGCAYHFEMHPIARSKGQSVVHTAAYNARMQLVDDRNERITNDYSRKGDLLFSGIFAPKEAPAWAQDRNKLWNEVEAADHKKNARPARNIIVALPSELTDEQRKHLVTDFARETFSRRGIVADVNIHAAHDHGDVRNIHAHILISTRQLEAEGFADHKVYDLDRTQTLEIWREKFANMSARALERAGYEKEAERWRHGYEPLDQQLEAALTRGDAEFAAKVDRSPSRHKGPRRAAMERRGIEVEPAPQQEAKELVGEIAAIEVELNALGSPYAKGQKIEAEATEKQISMAPAWGAGADVFEAYREARGNAQDFASGLSDRHLMMARVTAKDVQNFREARETAKESGLDRLPPYLHEGSYVAVTPAGGVVFFGKKTTGEYGRDVQTELDNSGLEAPSVHDAATLLHSLDDLAKQQRQDHLEEKSSARDVERQGLIKEHAQERAVENLKDIARGIEEGGNPLTVTDRTGVLKGISRIGDGVARVAEDLLTSIFAPPAYRFISPSERARDKEAHREWVEQQEREFKESEALENIRETIRRDHTVTATDIRNLSREGLEELKARGDDGLLSMIREREKEREQERERGMER